MSDFPFYDFNSREVGVFVPLANGLLNQNATDMYFLDVPAGIATYKQNLQSGRIIRGTTDLSQFRRAGGKAIVWHCSRDNLLTANATLDYFLQAKNTSGNAVQFYLARSKL